MGILKNFRRGFATNSSSSHSFVYMKKPNHEVGEVPHGMEFGWGDFRLETLKEKLFYVLVDRIGMNWNDRDLTADEVAKKPSQGHALRRLHEGSREIC